MTERVKYSSVCGHGLSASMGATMVDATMLSSSGAHGCRVGGSHGTAVETVGKNIKNFILPVLV